MDHDYQDRPLKFKAWDKESRLLMRLNAIECNKGELFKKNHILLQFTGRVDKEGEEIYDRDVLLVYSEKYVVFWNEEQGGWFFAPLDDHRVAEPLLVAAAMKMKRFCSSFELKC